MLVVLKCVTDIRCVALMLVWPEFAVVCVCVGVALLTVSRSLCCHPASVLNQTVSIGFFSALICEPTDELDDQQLV